MNEPARNPPADIPRNALFYALALFVLCFQQLLQWPIAWDLRLFLVYDPGSALKADALVASGLRPGIDFAYSYGLLSLDIGRLWFAVMGRTPLGYTSLTFACSILVALGIMHAALAMRFKTPALVLLLLLLPYAIYPYYLNQTHALEAVLLIWAIGFQARGKLSVSLALASTCLFIKPSMAYLYGFILTVSIIIYIFKSPMAARLSAFLKSFLPAALTLAIVSAYLTLRYGTESLSATLFPAGAARSYVAAGFGFFRAGKEFWLPAHPENSGATSLWNYYSMHEITFWLVAAVITTIFMAVFPIRELIRRRAISRADFTLLTIIFLHVCFVFLFYAWKDSWIYYAYLLTLATAGVANQLRGKWPARLAVIALTVVALIGLQYRFYWATGAWQQKVANADTAGLRAYHTQGYDELSEWAAVHQLLHDSGGLFLANGFASGLFPDIHTPRTWFLSPGLQTPAEMALIRQQIAASNVVVRYRETADQGLDIWNDPQLSDVTSAFKEQSGGKLFIRMTRILAR